MKSRNLTIGERLDLCFVICMLGAAFLFLFYFIYDMGGMRLIAYCYIFMMVLVGGIWGRSIKFVEPPTPFSRVVNTLMTGIMWLPLMCMEVILEELQRAIAEVKTT